MDAVLAISSLFGDLRPSTTLTGNPSQDATVSAPHVMVALPYNGSHISAMTHYSKALRRSRQGVSNGTATPVTAVLSCFLFICFEIIRGNGPSAISLFKNCSKMLSQLMSSPGTIEGQSTCLSPSLPLLPLAYVYSCL